MRNAIRVLIALVVSTVCSGSSLVTAPPLPRFTTAGAEGRLELPHPLDGRPLVEPDQGQGGW